MGSSRASQQYCRRFFCTVFFLSGSLLLYVFIFDPWQLFHQPWFRTPAFIGNARFQNAGIINSYDFDAAILGNSMAENFSAKEASKRLGGTFVNLSMAGSLFSERQVVLQHLFRKKKIKQLIVSLDHLPYVKVGQYSQDMPPEKFAFLYNGNPFDDFKIYLNVNLFRCWNFIKNKSCQEELPGAVRTKSLENLYQWFPYYIKAFGGTKAWCYWSTVSGPFKTFLQEIVNVSKTIEQGSSIPWAAEQIAECENNASSTFDTYILPFISEHRETQFLLFFPPYSRLWCAMQEQHYIGYYQTYLSFIKHVVKAAARHPNVLIFGFDHLEFTADIANYKDQSHYHKKINSKMLQLMAAQQHVLTNENVDAYLNEITRLAHEYDLKRIAAEFENCLK